MASISSLKELDLSRCSKITDAGIKHLLSIESLEKLCLSEIRLSADGVTHLSSFVNLRVLDLGGIPVTDKALSSLQVLTQLQYLDLWGSEISNIGATTFKKFPMLNYLNIAWTRVTRLPNLLITCLNMSKCDIHSIVDKENKDTALLSKLIVTGATFVDADEVFSFLQPGCLKFLDISSSNIVNFNFLVNLHGLEHLDLSYSQITDGLMEQVTSVGENLRYLNLSNTKITSHALSILAGCFPKLENLSLSHSLVDDTSLVYISMMPTLRVIDLSYTRIRGFVHSSREKSVKMLSLRELQNLPHLRSLNLEGTKAIDEALQPLSLLTELECLYLKSDFLTDISLNTLSSLRKLKFLGFCGGVITDYGLLSYRPPLFCVLDLRGCWLLSANAVYSFCRKHEKVEVRHEHINIPFVDENDSKSPILRLITEKSSKFPTSKSSFIDERIKYSTEELLQLENSPGSSRVLKDVDLMHEILLK